MSARVVVGLGNPGPRYAANRHNAGFLLLDRLAQDLEGAAHEQRSGSSRLRGRAMGVELILVKPLEFMNRSGPPVRAVLDEIAAEPADCLVVHDDLDLPLGRLKLKRDGGTGGHRGLESIVGALGRDDFARLRIGIGRPHPGSDVVEHVLEDFAPGEAPLFEAVLERARWGVLSWIEIGLEATMNRLNAVTIDLEGSQDRC